VISVEKTTRVGVYISFSREEKDLYLWILSKTKKGKKYRRGVSEFVKDILWSMYRAERAYPELKRIYVLKALLESARCRICGERLEVRRIEGEKIIFYCRRCAMLDSWKIPEETILDI
jgi:hypothetical protein